MVERSLKKKGNRKAPREYHVFDMVRVKQAKKSLGKLQWVSAQVIEKQMHYYNFEIHIFNGHMCVQTMSGRGTCLCTNYVCAQTVSLSV